MPTEAGSARSAVRSELSGERPECGASRGVPDKHFQVKGLVRTCCVWESMQNSYRDKADRLFSITITTGENTVTNKADWPKISWFFVKVQRFREDP